MEVDLNRCLGLEFDFFCPVCILEVHQPAHRLHWLSWHPALPGACQGCFSAGVLFPQSACGFRLWCTQLPPLLLNPWSAH